MCHLFSIPPGTADLHSLAERIGCKRTWFHNNHYNLSQTFKQRAIQAGATPLTQRQAGRLLMNERKHTTTKENCP